MLDSVSTDHLMTLLCILSYIWWQASPRGIDHGYPDWPTDR